MDYDGTYTQDSEFWDAFCDLARARGHEVICIAQREVSDRVAVTSAPAMLIHYIGIETKVAYCARKDIEIDVWIDNDPADL